MFKQINNIFEIFEFNIANSNRDEQRRDTLKRLVSTRLCGVGSISSSKSVISRLYLFRNSS
jgi:hypothetical protein